jgi:signal transduction histidine kinase
VVLEEEFDVHTAIDGPQGLAQVAQQLVDVVVLDLDLPGLHGIEVLDRLKQLDPLIEVVILTGQGTLETARQAMQLGAFAYLAKPFETQECRRVMRAARERRQKMLRWRALELELHRREVEQEIERAKSEIYATVIHDLNSPLTTAMGLLELMRIDVDSGNAKPADLAQQVNDASLQLKFCAGIIQRYLGFMRRTPGQAAAADMAGVLADLKKLVRTHAAVKQHQLIVHVPDEHLTVAVNGVDLLQVLLNLTVNALQASEQRHHVEVYCRHWPGGTATGLPAQGPNDLWLHPERIAGGPMASVTVQDDGAGIPADGLPLVFRSFHTTKEPGQGTGLGLTVIQRIVTECGGALHVHSVVGEGTAFTVFFPLAAS